MSLLFWATWALLGASVGSFLNVCILRWPAGESVVAPRSRCPRCQRQIRWYENIPILSWVALRARCAGCGLPISARYPLIELAIASIWVAAGLAYGPGLTAVRLAVFATILFGIAATDLEHYEIPDGFTIPGFLFVLVTAVAAALLGQPSPFAGPTDAFIGACTGAGVIAIIGWLAEAALKREAMGFGDVTLMAFAGAALGPWKAVATVFVGAALGAVIFVAVVLPFARRRAPATTAPAPAADASAAADAAPVESNTDDEGRPLVPFGVFLAPAALIVLLWGDALFAAYLRLVLP